MIRKFAFRDINKSIGVELIIKAIDAGVKIDMSYEDGVVNDMMTITLESERIIVEVGNINTYILIENSEESGESDIIELFSMRSCDFWRCDIT